MGKTRFTVLVVDDEGALRRLIMRELRRNGMAPIGAANGQAGLAAFLANREKIDLVILDMLMPGMSGLDLAAELGRQDPALKILYISGHGTSIAMESLRQQSADRVLLKPFNEQALLERVELLLSVDQAGSAPGQNCEKNSA